MTPVGLSWVQCVVSPKKPTAHVKSGFLKIRATEAQLERWQRAGELAHLENEELDYSSWVRWTLNAAAKELEERHPLKRGKSVR